MSAGDIVVFLGPSLPRQEAKAILQATYLPPAEQGSVMRAWLDYRPRVLVLIDGVFGSVPAVRHMEILWACANGLSVFGAASIGAIRAAELVTIGMQGHGLIYRWYRCTPFADDDEVAVAMSPPALGAVPLSDALISMRLTLMQACRQKVISREQRLALEAIARATIFVDRSYVRLMQDARDRVPADWSHVLTRLEHWLADNRVDQKQLDAVGLLTRLAVNPDLLATRPTPPPFQLTEAWAHDLSADGLWNARIIEAMGIRWM
jgi:hypothetical protein